MGWVIIDFQGIRPSPVARIASVQLALGTGQDFSAVAKQYSEALDATSGADMGWVFKYQLSKDLQDAIWQIPVGGTSRVVVDTNGWHLYKVLAEETRTPDANTQLTLKSQVFSTWLSDLGSAANIWTDSAGLTAMTPTATP
jgi:parvulin-like peptidyl-prolyl isomerase